MRAGWNNLKHRAGRRGAFLLFLAILDFAYGYSLIDTTATAHKFDLFLPYPYWAITWIIVGVICATGIFANRDRWAFTFAAMLKFAWGLLWLDIWLGQGFVHGWISAVVWLAFSAVVLIISGWPEEADEIVLHAPKGPP